MPTTPQRKRLLLLMPPGTYRAEAFRSAAVRNDVEVVTGVDLPAEIAEQTRVCLNVDFRDIDASVRAITRYASERKLDAILSVDDAAAVLAARAAEALGLVANDPNAALATRDKYRMRELFAVAGVPSPNFRRFDALADPAAVATSVDYPCVVKPRHLSGSRGVIRANGRSELIAAFTRLRQMLHEDGNDLEQASILVEDFIPGVEVALEGLLTDGRLDVLAIFDKPDPLDGPFFEETIYVTPSRLPIDTQQAIGDCAARAMAALGLRHGPVHAELRVNERGPWLLEVAGRSIGGLCSTVLEFGTGLSLEDLIVRHAVGLPATHERESGAAGAMMIPIPGAGILKSFSGMDEARQVPGVTGVEISAKLNHRLIPLPEGGSYLGFIFARGADPAFVEAALRESHSRLSFVVVPELPILNRHLVLREPTSG